MKQAKQYKRTYTSRTIYEKPTMNFGRLEFISVSCEHGKYTVFRDGKRVDSDSVAGMKILKMFVGMNILEQGKPGCARGQVYSSHYE